ncbi:MAG: bis(5'-nucleosyl)-tetraphosphatase (symmetrical) YqeK [Synechococcales cyanobacterium C42_A2020_086]|jgi:predicted HD superfamily hydrolase involved in NAD metabolism|nr:bis(5'-nucleosyl)-tetraphosphatase (symmetrical) YqeK [Synechococcales cyanobacterium C42_A2020_086]
MTVYFREQSSPIARQQVLSWLTRQVPDSRIQHILRVEQLAADLAQIHHLDPEQAAQAGLMHDLAKYFKPQQLLDIAHQEGWALDPVELANPHLLHANVSAVVARDEFGIEDQDILDAIADHTLGRPGMGSLSCVVFLADSLEPGRGDSPELHLLRQISHHSLEQAVWMTCDYTLQHLLAKRRPIHPRAVQTRNWFLQHASQQRANGVSDQVADAVPFT